MKKNIRPIIISFISLFLLVLISNKITNINQLTEASVSEFVFLDLDGNSVVYGANQKTDVILFLISDTCDSCRESLKWLSQQDESIQKKVELVSVSGIDETKELIKEYNIKSRYYIDDKKSTITKMNVDSLPMVFSNVNGVYEKTRLSIQDAIKQ